MNSQNSCVTVRDCVLKTHKEERPWGGFKTLAKNLKNTIKIIEIEPCRRLSLQYHRSRFEHWVVIRGACLVTIGDKTFDASEGDEFSIYQNTPHRVEAKMEKVVIVEVSVGYFDEDDIVRIEDDYRR